MAQIVSLTKLSKKRKDISGIHRSMTSVRSNLVGQLNALYTPKVFTQMENDQRICYQCGKIGHYVRKCRQPEWRKPPALQVKPPVRLGQENNPKKRKDVIRFHGSTTPLEPKASWRI